MTTRKIDHKQLKARDANVGDILRVTGSDDLSFINPNSIVVPALTAGDNITIEANGLIVGAVQTFTGNTDVVPEGVNNLYFEEFRVVQALANTFNVVTGNIIPATDGAYNLGNATHRWGTIFVSGQTISLGNLYLKEVADKLVITTDPANVESDTGLVDLTTDDILEGSNLYFTNTRAIGSLTGGDNITIEANGLIVGQPGYDDAAALAAVKDTLSTSNVIEGSNLYFTNQRAIDAVVGNIETDDIPEGSNLYYTNARVAAYIADSIFTSNITEDGNTTTGNVYFTNARAVSSLTAGTNVHIDSNGLISVTGITASPTYTDLTVDGDLTVNGNLLLLGNATTIQTNSLEVDDPLIHLAANNETSDSVDIGFLGHYSPDSGVTKNHTGIFRKHGSNSFYVFSSYVDENLDSGNTVTNIDIANATFRLANVHAGYFIGNVVGTVSSLANHDTDDLVEGSNLYFTNTRAIGSLTAGDGITIEANGLIVGAGTYTDSNAEAAIFDVITTSNVIEGANLYFTNARVYANVIGLIDALTTDEIEEGSNLYFTNTRAIGAFTAGDNIAIEANGLIVGQPGYTDSNAEAAIFDVITTSNVLEGSNLYFSNVRAIEAVELAVTKLDVSASGSSAYLFDQYSGNNPNIYINAGETLAFDLGVGGHPFLIKQTPGGTNYSTGLIHVADDGTISTGVSSQGQETGVLYWKIPFDLRGNTYVYQCSVHSGMVGNIVIRDPSDTGIRSVALDGIDTDDVPEGTANLYFTNTRAIGSLTGGEGIEVSANGLLTANLSGLSVEASNVFATDIQVSGNVIANGLVINGFEILSSTSAGDINANTLTANVVISQAWSGIYTDNVIEGSNLYLTNARVVGAFTAGNSIVLESNGYIDIDPAYITYASSQLFEGDAVENVFTMNNAVTNEDLIIVTVDGSVLVPTTQYTVDGNQLTLVTTPGNGANVEVRYLNTQTSTVLEYYNRAYQGNGVQTVFQVSSGLASNSLLVFENGVAQVPYVDYTIVGANIVFVSPPSANTVVHIRELPKLNITERLTANTDAITEASNLYFTNARVYAALAAGENITIEANGLIVGEQGIDADNGTLGNLVLTGNITTPEAYITNLTVSGNLTVTGNLTTINAQSLEITDPLIKLAANNESSDAVDMGWVGHYSPDSGTTRQHAGVFRDADDGHFYIFSEYVDEDLEVANTVTNIDRANNTFKLATVHANIFVGNVTGTVSSLANHDTDDLPEGTSNLYFSNAKAVGALTAGEGINIEANGLISSGVSAITLADSSTFSGNGVTQQYTLTQNVTSNDFIIVNVDGLMARPTVDYGVSANTILTFTSAPVDGANIEVRYMGTTYATPASSTSIVRRAMVTAILFG